MIEKGRSSLPLSVACDVSSTIGSGYRHDAAAMNCLIGAVLMRTIGVN